MSGEPYEVRIELTKGDKSRFATLEVSQESMEGMMLIGIDALVEATGNAVSRMRINIMEEEQSDRERRDRQAD